jgi:hypothetical protein
MHVPCFHHKFAAGCDKRRIDTTISVSRSSTEQRPQLNAAPISACLAADDVWQLRVCLLTTISVTAKQYTSALVLAADDVGQLWVRLLAVAAGHHTHTPHVTTTRASLQAHSRQDDCVNRGQEAITAPEGLSSVFT